MGLVKGSATGKGKIFLKIDGRDGCFVEAVKHEGQERNTYEKTPSGTVLSGVLVGLGIKEEAHTVTKKMSVKLMMEFADPDPAGKNMVVEAVMWRQAATSDDPNVGTTSKFALGILAGLNAADLSKPIDLMPWSMKKGDALADGAIRTTDGAGVSFRQGGIKLVPRFIENGIEVERLAPLPQQTFAGVVHYDKSGWDNVAQEMFQAVQDRLKGPEPQDMSDSDDDSIDAAQAAQAANAGMSRQRA